MKYNTDWWGEGRGTNRPGNEIVMQRKKKISKFGTLAVLASKCLPCVIFLPSLSQSVFDFPFPFQQLLVRSKWSESENLNWTSFQFDVEVHSITNGHWWYQTSLIGLFIITTDWSMTWIAGMFFGRIFRWIDCEHSSNFSHRSFVSVLNIDEQSRIQWITWRITDDEKCKLC